MQPDPAADDNLIGAAGERGPAGRKNPAPLPKQLKMQLRTEREEERCPRKTLLNTNLNFKAMEMFIENDLFENTLLRVYDPITESYMSFLLKQGETLDQVREKYQLMVFRSCVFEMIKRHAKQAEGLLRFTEMGHKNEKILKQALKTIQENKNRIMNIEKYSVLCSFFYEHIFPCLCTFGEKSKIYSRLSQYLVNQVHKYSTDHVFKV